MNWQTSQNEEDRRFCLTLRGTRGEITVEQEACSKAAASGITKFSRKQTLFSSSPAGQQPSITTVASDGTERLIEAWGHAIRTSRESIREDREPAAARSHPGFADVDVKILQAMFMSRGNKIRV